jgi:hypothetical protein
MGKVPHDERIEGNFAQNGEWIAAEKAIENFQFNF